MKITIVTSGMLMLVFSVATQAQILKCVGKDGKIEFATSCPSGTRQQDTGVGNKPAATPAAAKSDATSKEGAADKDASAKKPAAPTLADRDAEFRKRQADQKEAAAKSDKTAAEAQDRQRACDTAKSILKTITDRSRMVRNDPKTGERVGFEEADYVRELPIAERQVAENCKA